MSNQIITHISIRSPFILSMKTNMHQKLSSTLKHDRILNYSVSSIILVNRHEDDVPLLAIDKWSVTIENYLFRSKDETIFRIVFAH